MSLTSALANANSGLAAATRTAQVVSSNVANALTEGYGRREVNLGAAVLGGGGAGVRVTGVERVVNQVAINERRLSEAASGAAEKEATFYAQLNAVLGSSEDPNSLTGRIAGFEAALISSAATPESTTQLSTAVNAARDLTSAFNSAAKVIQDARQSADQSIANQVSQINDALSIVADLNNQIRTQSVSGFDTTALFDQRQQLVDQISEMIPIQEIPREHGRIALMTSNGTILVEEKAAQFDFSPTSTLVPEMTIQSGGLSGLSISGSATLAGSALSAISGGGLAATFALRDEAAVNAQASLDALARDLIERTNAPTVDPTIGGGPGLFTDNGAVFDPLDEVGLSARLSLNAAVDPRAGGEIWRLRDGVGAAVQGPVGETGIINAMHEALSQNQSGATRLPFSNLASEYQSGVGSALFQAENRLTFATSQVAAFGDAERAFGVDTDQEMQKLLSIEQNYAANARVIQTIDEMMQSLLRI
ncbi:MAG: flagellar hook-associated protein FlgK [Pseudomonadota bacterium]